ncbi:MAG: hypothetical protein OXJ52_09420 [Oligoflexia bacterium]|nr:hypothetical protein [Oligoflexia bacterium]
MNNLILLISILIVNPALAEKVNVENLIKYYTELSNLAKKTDKKVEDGYFRALRETNGTYSKFELDSQKADKDYEEMSSKRYSLFKEIESLSNSPSDLTIKSLKESAEELKAKIRKEIISRAILEKTRNLLDHWNRHLKVAKSNSSHAKSSRREIDRCLQSLKQLPK